MIELRWARSGEEISTFQLQQRTRDVQVDASGAFCGFGEWSEWTAVPIVETPHVDVVSAVEA